MNAQLGNGNRRQDREDSHDDHDLNKRESLISFAGQGAGQNFSFPP
jgi:hypothetical protein